jgi:hypothetical protein
MPTPVSRTRSTASLPSRRSSTSMRPPPGVYFSALPTKLETFCSTLASSARTQTGFQYHLTKPVDAIELEQLLARVLA